MQNKNNILEEGMIRIPSFVVKTDIKCVHNIYIEWGPKRGIFVAV